MALLAESLVEEWLNRKGFFTIRGVKHGAGEMDLLAVSPQPNGVIGWHIEVQVSFRPIGYISKQTLTGDSGRTHSYVRARTRTQEEACARGWVGAKFRDPDKAQLRERLWPGIAWSFHLVHGVVRYPRELEVFASEGVTCHPFHQLLSDLSRHDGHPFSGSAGGDLAEIVGYYKTHETGSAQPGCFRQRRDYASVHRRTPSPRRA